MTRPVGLLLFVALFTVAIIMGVATQVDAILPSINITHGLASLLFFDRFLLDFMIALLVGVLLVSAGLPGRVLCYAWCTIFFLTNILQLLSIYIGGEFVTFLAVDNINHISLMVDSGSMLGGVLFGLLVLAFVLFIEKYCYTPKNGKSTTVIVICALAGAILMHQASKWLPAEIVDARDSYYASKSNRIAHKSPMESFYKVLFREKSHALRRMAPGDIEHAMEYGIVVRPDQRYPLVKDAIYRQPLPFAQSMTQESSPGLANVIVIFAEGMSARTLNIYNELEPGLTPNLQRFARDAMVVNNYYNHTYATYRSLQGQLCSFYPTFGGHGGWDTHYDELKQVKYLCLSDLLNNAGYETIFLDTHRRDAGFIDEMMAELDFDQVINAEDVVDRYLGEEPLRRDSLSDNQLFDGLIGLLKELELNQQDDDNSRPFFLSLYNLETHAFQKIRKDGKPYPLKDDYVLDSIHNYDYAFGRFWDYFRESSLARDTIIVFTSDHAHYPDRDFREVVRNESDYQPYFVDRIPLVIHDPGRDLPAQFDAQFASSVDFAPTMAHYLGLENSANPFVGNSIFERNPQKPPKSLASADLEHYLISPGGITASDPLGNNSGEMEYVDYLLKTLRQLERHDRLWPD